MSADERLLDWYRAVVDEYRSITPRSAAMFVRGGGVLPGGDTRYSITTRPHPPYFERGEGPYIWDVDGNRRLDLNNNSTASDSRSRPSGDRGSPSLPSRVRDSLGRTQPDRSRLGPDDL